MRMRQIVWLTILTCAATALPARADGSSLDIEVDGPWIVLAKNVIFHNKDGKDASVIVLIAPGADSAMYFPHLPPEMISGDGYRIDPGIYCVAFGSECAPVRSGASFTSGNYPSPNLLPVNTPSGWSWFGNRNDPNARYLILPLPDSYSAEGFWYMEFATEFNVDDSAYTDHEKPAIGIQLHYANAPSILTLFPCTPSTTVAPGYSTCDGANASKGSVINSGTVHLTMKNTNFDDVCDPHVRAAHPMMLKLLDPTPLGKNSKNVNNRFAYVDPAIDSSNGNGTYDNAITNRHCRDKDDPQNPNYVPPSGGGPPPVPATPQLMLMQQQSQNPLEMTTPSILEELNRVADELKHQKEKDQGELLTAQINAQANALSGTIPTISQLRLVASLLDASAVAAKALKLDQLAKQERTLADDTGTKDGKDCKAAIMLIQ
jgi:hypothetical protein